MYDAQEDYYYVNMPFVGIIPESIVLYSGNLDYTNAENPFEFVVGEGVYEFDEYDNLIKITHLPSNLRSVWMTCEYIPNTYWTKVQNYWLIEKNKITEKKNNLETELTIK